MDNGLVPTSDETFKKMVCVLILVVVDNGLVLLKPWITMVGQSAVLILVLVDNGLVPMTLMFRLQMVQTSLNPCFSGQWSSTRLYKTLLIINKLKNFTKEIFTFLN